MNKAIKPFYLVDFTSSVCNFEIYVNDMPVFIFKEGGSISSQYPINHYLLESGEQNIKIKILPLKKESFLRDDGSVEIKIHFYDAFDNNYANLIEIFKFESPDFSEQKFPQIEFNGIFNAEFPYKINGWKNSLSIDNKKSEIEKALVFYKTLHSEVKKENYEKIGILQTQKLNEINTALYIENSNNSEEWQKIIKEINSNNMKLEEFPSNPVTLFYGEGKVINIIREDGNPILHFKNNNHEEFVLPILIHKKNLDFEIIR